jgi:glycosyltransferase involved in cell wall biosynthesis
LLPQRPDIRVLLSGAGDPGWAFATLSDQDRRAVEAVTERAGLADTDELIRRYQAATVTVLPAKEEAFGIILVESLACGTPVVACTGSGMTEIVEDPASGRLAQYGDVDDLARALEDTITLAADPATPARCRQAATRFSWADRIGPVHEDLYRRVARSSRRHAT